MIHFLDAHTSSLMMSDSDSEDDEEILFDDDLNRQQLSNGNLTKRYNSNGRGPLHQDVNA